MDDWYVSQRIVCIAERAHWSPINLQKYVYMPEKGKTYTISSIQVFNDRPYFEIAELGAREPFIIVTYDSIGFKPKPLDESLTRLLTATPVTKELEYT